jgi:hypothetical protein
MSEKQVTWTDIDEALGLRSSGGVDTTMVANFREAGFDESQAQEGARLMASGMYFGFADVATSLQTTGDALGNRTVVAPGVRDYKIAEVAKRVDAATPIAEAVAGEHTAEATRRAKDTAAFVRENIRDTKVVEAAERLAAVLMEPGQ